MFREIEANTYIGLQHRLQGKRLFKISLVFSCKGLPVLEGNSEEDRMLEIFNIPPSKKNKKNKEVEMKMALLSLNINHE